MARKQTTPDGLDAVFTAIEALTYREHLQLASLLSLQAEEVPPSSEEGWARLLADTAESYFEAEDEEE